jgi:glutathione S-transferase
MLFGENTSSADVVTTVLLGRLKMIGEYGLVDQGSSLDRWFNRMQTTPAFKQADLWIRFQPWRIIFKR